MTYYNERVYKDKEVTYHSKPMACRRSAYMLKCKVTMDGYFKQMKLFNLKK